MKERFLYDGELEKQLKEKADQFKMYPSDKVWNEVYGSLHTRRRRFVAGMSILIGSILILAGSQLIFPSKSVQGKTIAARVNTAKPPVAGVDIPSFAADDLVNTASVNATDQKTQFDKLVLNSPYITSATASETLNDPSRFAENLPDKNISTARERSGQPDNIVIPDQPGTSATETTQIHDGVSSIQNNAESNSVSAELSPEKSAAQLTHLRNDRYSWEIYVTPTLNTRYLTGLNYQTMAQSLQSSPIMLVNVSNVNGFVDNTPVLGYNVGGNILYKLTKNISLKAGLEFSFNRYYIKAYNSNASQTSVALNSYFGYISDPTNSISATGTDKNPQQYQNRYYQLSLPLGVEMKAAGNGKVQLRLGASLQPSYLLNTDAYVLSDDYKGYSKDAQAFRRWNLNVGAEAYISYAVGNIRWELGPQVRYQIFSTYKDSYPLKENMLNYGIRIGISKTIR